MTTKVNHVPKTCSVQSYLVPLRSSRRITRMSILSSSIGRRGNPARLGDQQKKKSWTSPGYRRSSLWCEVNRSRGLGRGAGGAQQAQRTEDLFQRCIKLQLASQTPTRCLVPSAMASWERPQRKMKSAVTRDYKQKKKTCWNRTLAGLCIAESFLWPGAPLGASYKLKNSLSWGLIYHCTWTL